MKFQNPWIPPLDWNGEDPIVDPRRCVACKLCIPLCPTDAIIYVPEGKVQWGDDDPGTYTPDYVRIDIDRCISCGACEQECPYSAIFGNFHQGGGGTNSGGGDEGGGGASAPKLILSLQDRVKYPVLARIVDGLYQKVKNDPKLMEALKKYSHLSEQQILQNLVPGKGPNVVVKDLGDNRYGHYDSKTNSLEIDLTVANSNSFIDPGFTTALDLFLTRVVIHEFVHFGENFTQKYLPHDGSIDDAGFKFENEMYGGILSFNTVTGELTYRKMKYY